MTLADRLMRATSGRNPIALMALPAISLLTAVTVPLSVAHAQAPAATMTVLTPKQNEKLGANRFNLDVRFQSVTNSPIVTAELWVDGVRWVRRDLDTPRRASVLSFLVDGSTLPAGTHTVVVKVLNAEGNISSAKLDIVAGSDEAAGETEYAGPEVRFVNPGNGRKVVGTVELLIDAKTRNGQNPYVSFYVDDKFKTLKNYPPYSFVWDTTNESNGTHTITASGYLDSTNATTTRKITVFVNNPGGNTKRYDAIPDLSSPKAARKATTGNTVARPLTVLLPVAKETQITAPSGEARITESAAASIAATDALGLRMMDTGIPAAPRQAIPRLAPPRTTILAPSGTPPRAVPRAKIPARPSPAVAANALPLLSGEPTLSAAGAVTDLDEAVTLDKIGSVGFAAPKLVIAPRLSRPTTLIAAPMRGISPVAVTRARISIATPVAPVAHIRARRVSISTPKADVTKVVKVARRTDGMEPIQVAFDGTRIAFDVAPRVEAGMPIAPFRQIFEHTGGKVSWSNETKTMRAVNSNREIVIGVGKKTAIVNGTSISMDRAASLDRGRTVVPLNFVGKALDVDVKYDSVTGRLSITSKK